jgi:cytochrome c oxidase cbb3-type subunit 3
MRPQIVRPRFLVVLIASAVSGASAQAPVSGPPAHIVGAYPERITDPEAVERGRAFYAAYGCAFCHGEDIRGGSGGPSLLRSQLVQRDQAGETIAPVIRGGVPNTLMVGMNLADNEIEDIAEFLHSFELSSRDPARNRPETIVTGDAAAGRRYFEQHCTRCHSVTGDLRGVASRYADPRELQTNWLMPREAPPVTVRVTTNAGEIVEGTLSRMDEFSVSLELADGWQRSFKRMSNTEPRIELDNPLEAHENMLAVYTDPDIHNVTAYLVTID